MVNQIIVRAAPWPTGRWTVRAESRRHHRESLRRALRARRCRRPSNRPAARSTTAMARLEQARAELAAAQMEFDAPLNLSERGYRAETDVAPFPGRARTPARAAVNLAELKLDDLMIRAPFDGLGQRADGGNRRLRQVGGSGGDPDRPAPAALSPARSPNAIWGKIRTRLDRRGAPDRRADGRRHRGLCRRGGGRGDPHLHHRDRHPQSGDADHRGPHG